MVCVLCLSTEKRFKMDDQGTVEMIDGRLKLMSQKMKQLVNSWNENTRGLQMGPDGKVYG
jgi:hypothetical protein